MLQWLTGEPPVQILEINQVWNEVIKVIEDAKENLILVSPYNDYSVPLKEALQKAAEDVHIMAVCREEQKGKEDEHFKWLGHLGADVHLVSRLHAKIYYNESTAIVTSMNLLKSSATDSKEIGFKINDPKMRDQIREYVQEKLIAHSKPIPHSKPIAPPRSTAKPPSTPTPKAKPPKTPARGLCIRGGEEIPYNPERPLCSKCFRSWNKFGNPDYVENHCHRCGEEHETSFAEPLCTDCR